MKATNVQSIRFAHNSAKFELRLSNNGATLKVDNKVSFIEDEEVPAILRIARVAGKYPLVWQPRYQWAV